MPIENRQGIPKRPKKLYSLKNYRLNFNRKELNFLEFIKQIENKRNDYVADLSSKENLNTLLLHLKSEQILIDELTKCLLKIDLRREYEAIILDDSGNVPSDYISGSSVGVSTTLPALSANNGALPSQLANKGAPPPPPPPQPPVGKGAVTSAIQLPIKKSVSISNLEKMLKNYKISTSQLPKELAKLTSSQQVVDFLDSAKKDLRSIEKAIQIELMVQDKVATSIEDFLNTRNEILGGSDNHAKISVIKFFLHRLYREIYVEDDVNFALVEGVYPYEIKRDEFYQLDYNKESYTKLAGKTPKELNELIEKEISDIVEAIRAIKNKAKDTGCFNADQLANCMQELSNIEQKAFMALNLSGENLESFEKTFAYNRPMRESYNNYPCNKCLIALSSLHLLLSLTAKGVKYSNELGIVEQNDLEKLFFILMESSSLEQISDNLLEDMFKSVSTVEIKNTLKTVELGNIGSSRDNVINLLKNKDFVLSKDPITWLPVYVFGFVKNNKKTGSEDLDPNCLLGYLSNLRSNLQIIIDKDKFKKLFQDQFRKEISDKYLEDWKKIMEQSLRNFREKDKLIKAKPQAEKSSLTEECQGLLDVLKLNQETATTLKDEYGKKAKQEKLKLLSTVKLMEYQNLHKTADLEQEKYEKFCSNVFKLVVESVDINKGIVRRLAKINEFVQAASGCSSLLYTKKSIIKGTLTRQKTAQLKPVVNKQSMTPKDYMDKEFAACLGNLLAWLDNEDKLQLSLTESEYLRLENHKNAIKSELNVSIQECKNEFTGSQYEEMDSNQKRNLEIRASSFKKHFLKINNIFTVNLYSTIATFKQAKELLTTSEAIDFLKAIMYRDLVINYKNSEFCDSELLKTMQDEGNIHQYFDDLQSLSNLRNTFFNKIQGTDLFTDIKEKLGIDLSSDNALKNIAKLTSDQFETLIKRLKDDPECPSYFSKIAASNNVTKGHEIFKDLCKDIEKYQSFIATMNTQYKKEITATGIPLDDITSLEEASNKLPSNLFARFIIHCIAEQNKKHNQIENSLKLIENLNDLDHLTQEQITLLSHVIEKNHKRKDLSDVKYFGLPEDLRVRDCVFVSMNYIDDNEKVKSKYTTLTETDLPSSQNSYYKSAGFKSQISEQFENHIKFLYKINSQSLLSNFTLVELAIIIRCLDTKNLSQDQKNLIKEAHKLIGNSGEGLVEDFAKFIEIEEVREAMVEAIQNSFIEYMETFVGNLFATHADDMDIERIIDKDEDNILHIITGKIGREFRDKDALVELDLSVDSAGQSIDNLEKIAKGQTLLELFNAGVRANPEIDIKEFSSKAEEELEEAKKSKKDMLRQAFLIAVNKAKTEREDKTKSWAVENQQRMLISTKLSFTFNTFLQKEIDNLNMQKNLFQLVFEELPRKDVKFQGLEKFLKKLNQEIDSFFKFKTTNFDDFSTRYIQTNKQSFEEIKKSHVSIIETSNKLFGDDSFRDDIESIYQMTYEKLFESNLDQLLTEHVSFVAGKRYELDTLNKEFLDYFTNCINKVEEINKLMEHTKQDFGLQDQLEKHKKNLNLEQIQDQAAKQLVELRMEIQDQVHQFEEAKNNIFKIERERLEEQEKNKRLLLEQEAFGKDGVPDIIRNMEREIQKQREQEAKNIHEQTIEHERKLNSLIVEELEKSRKEAQILRELEQARKNVVVFNQMDKGAIDREREIATAQALLWAGQITKAEFAKIKDRQR